MRVPRCRHFRQPLLREHRLYQADWLLRFYGFATGEIATGADGNLPLEMDPKLAWALAHRGQFPVDVNVAPREMLLRVPGLGVRTVDLLLSARRHRRLRAEDLLRLRVPARKALPFLLAEGHRPRGFDSAALPQRMPRQGRLFA
jgi:predicted DNA-binding helix-hairpin-helix protein